MKKLTVVITMMILILCFSAAAANTVAIDPGHQGEWVDMSAQEPVAPGSSQMKAKCSTGTTGRFTGVPEYQLNLDISLKLRDELMSRGYDVILTREDNDAAVSNAERALMAAEKGGDVYVRIHANGSDDPGTSGALAMVMSPGNPYVGGLYEKSCALAGDILNSYCARTGFQNLGIQYYDDMTGINWSRIPVMILEMGFMTNESDDRNMQDAAMQDKMVQGIADGLDGWFAVYGEEPGSPGGGEKASLQGGSVSGAADGAQSPDAAQSRVNEAGAAGAQAWTDIGADVMNTQKKPELAERLYEQFIMTREMIGEKWSVGFMKVEAGDGGYPFAREAGEGASGEHASGGDGLIEDTDTGLTDQNAVQKQASSDPAEENPAQESEKTAADGIVSEADEMITGTDEAWMIRGDMVMQSASVIKLFIMGCVYDRICYPSSPERTIPYTESYEGELRALLESMITVSSNEAANALIDILGQGNTQAGKEAVDAFAKEHGYEGVHLGRKFLESNPTDDNYLSANACMKFLSDICSGRLVNEEASGKMLDILKGQTVKRKIPSGLPSGYLSANKTGEMPEGYGLGCIENDTAVIWPPVGDPYILVVLSNDLGGRNDEASEIIRQISSFVASQLEG